MDQPSPTVTIATLGPGHVTLDYCRSLVAFMTHEQTHANRVRNYFPKYASGLLSVHRNACIDAFLRGDTEYIWFIDSDIDFPVDTLDKLLEVASVEKPVVSGMYPMILDGGIKPSAFRFGKIQHKTLPKEVTTLLPIDEPLNGIVEVDGVGAGMLLIHRSLLSAMREIYGHAFPWFVEAEEDDVAYGEDFGFCLRVRQMGFKIYLNSDAGVGHVKQQILPPSLVLKEFV